MDITIPKELGEIFPPENEVEQEFTLLSLAHGLGGYYFNKGLAKLVQHLIDTIGLKLIFTDMTATRVMDRNWYKIKDESPFCNQIIQLSNWKNPGLETRKEALQFAEQKLQTRAIDGLEYLMMTSDSNFEVCGILDPPLREQFNSLYRIGVEHGHELSDTMRGIQSELFDRYREFTTGANFDSKKNPDLYEFDKDLGDLRSFVRMMIFPNIVKRFQRNRHRFTTGHLKEKLDEYDISYEISFLDQLTVVIPFVEELVELVPQIAKSKLDYILDMFGRTKERTALVVSQQITSMDLPDLMEAKGIYPYRLTINVVRPSFGKRDYDSNLIGNNEKQWISEVKIVDNSDVLSLDEMECFRQLFPKYQRNFIVRAELASGAYKRTVQLFNMRSSQSLALKIVDISKLDEKALKYISILGFDNPLDAFENEVERMKKLNSSKNEHISGLVDSGVSGNYYFFVEDFSEKTLFDYVTKNHPVTYDMFEGLSLQLIDGLAAIHESGLYHGDLHPSNILFRNGLLTITDFGLCSSLPSDDRSLYGIPHSEIRAPELFKKVNPSAVADVWACCVNILFVKDGKMPFQTTFEGTKEEWEILSDQEREVYRNGVLTNIESNYDLVQEHIDIEFPSNFGGILKRGLDRHDHLRISDASVMKGLLKESGFY